VQLGVQGASQAPEPVALQVWPAGQAGFPLQVHVPIVHVSVVPVQSASVQHSASGMQLLVPHAFEPAGH
jgi:hypothetical protein